MSVCSGNSLFGSASQNIKTNGGDLIATQGSNIMERLILNDVIIPYKQINKSRIVLSPGQKDYLLSTMGDNYTFLAIKVTYAPKSKIEEDNYMNWSYVDDRTRVYTIYKLQILNSNSTNRIKNIYLSNPNSKASIYIDILTAVIDDKTDYYDNTNQMGSSIVSLRLSNIKTHIVGESIKIVSNSTSNPSDLMYIPISSMLSIQNLGNILILNTTLYGKIFLDFLTIDDALQSESLLNHIINNPNVNINTLSPIEDMVAPVVYFNSRLLNINSNDFIYLNGNSSGVPYNSSLGFTFSSTCNLNMFTSSSFGKEDIIDMFIDSIVDNRDGEMSISSSNIIIDNDPQIQYVTQIGTYSIGLTLSDMVGNDLSNIKITLNVI